MSDIVSNSPQQNNEKGKGGRRAYFREIVDLILPDSLMIFLAVIMVPLILVPLFVNIPQSLTSSFIFIDYFILDVYIIEYVAKAFLSPKLIKHVLNPWHLLDFFIVVISLISVLPVFAARFGFSPLLLRLVRIVRVLAVGGRAVDRRIQMSGADSESKSEEDGPLNIRIVDASLENVLKDIPFDKIGEYLRNHSQTWVDISGISDDYLDDLSKLLDIPRLILDSELSEESYPRVDYFEHYAMIFARVADVKFENTASARLSVRRNGILIICHGRNIITLSVKQNDVFSQILERAKKNQTAEEPLTVSILYSILKDIIEKDKQIIRILEMELMKLENVPSHKRQPDFLEAAFYLRKEVNQLVPSLLHLKEIIAMITSRRMPLEGFNEQYEHVFDILTDETSYLYETASSARDNLQSLVDLYINTTSYQMNQVMRMIAVITSLGIIPAIMGLLGSNILGTPWDIQLWQVFTILGILMLIMGWIFYRLGWLKG